MESFQLLDYPNVTMETKGFMASGRLKLTDTELQFKPAEKSGKRENVAKEDIDIVNWQRLAGTWGIRIFTNDGNLHRFAGFKEAEREKLAKFFSQTYEKDMLDRELSVKGWNWGTANFNGNSLSFEVGQVDAFEIPLSSVQQSTAGKNEVALEFHANDEAAVSLSEIRFHIPSTDLAGDEDPVEAFREAVMKKASVVTTSGDAIAILQEVSCLSPRGRYSIKFFPNYVQLHGKTYDYKILTTSMVRLFLLPHKDGRQMHVTVNCDPPIKQGQTRHHYLVLIFKEEEEEEVGLTLTEEEIKEKYDGKLEKEMSGKTYEIISKLFKAVTGRKLTVPGSFVGHSGTPAVTCSYSRNSGFLYPLERGIVYIYKPPIYLRYDQIQRVEFERTEGASRSFDVIVTTIHDIVHTFSSIEKGEYSKLYDYLKSKNLKITTTGAGAGTSRKWDDKGIDHHLEKVKQDAESSSGSDNTSSDDTDFKPDALEALSAKEEYDSEPSTTSSENESDDYGSGSDAERKREEKRKQKAEKKVGKERKKEKSGERKEKRVKKKKLTKVPGQPKKSMGAYFLWLNANRDRITKDHPGLSMIERTKKAGEMWRELEDKSEWNTKAEEDKKRYEKELEKWKAEGGEVAMKAAKKKAKKEEGADSSKKSKESNPSSSKTGSHFQSKEFIDSGEESSD